MKNKTRIEKIENQQQIRIQKPETKHPENTEK